MILYGTNREDPAGCGNAADETSVIARLRNGEQQATSELHDRYAKLVYALALRVLQDSVAAEDVLQDVFSRLRRDPNAFDNSPSSLTAWLTLIGRNRSIDGLRKRLPETAIEASVSDPHRRNESERTLVAEKVHGARIPPR